MSDMSQPNRSAACQAGPYFIRFGSLFISLNFTVRGRTCQLGERLARCDSGDFQRGFDRHAQGGTEPFAGSGEMVADGPEQSPGLMPQNRTRGPGAMRSGTDLPYATAGSSVAGCGVPGMAMAS